MTSATEVPVLGADQPEARRVPSTSGPSGMALRSPFAGRPPRRRSARASPQRSGSLRWLALIGAVQVGLTYRPGFNRSAFEDEGLYVYIGHRMIAHLLHGAVVTEYPGHYFSGLPGLYPVLAAMADRVAGLPGARGLSLVFALGATLAVFGLGAELLEDQVAGLAGAAVFATCGPVLFIGHFATYDSMAVALLAAGAWLTIRSARRDGLLWAPAAGTLLALAFLVKYGAGAYIPFVALLGVLVAPAGARWTVAFRSLTVLAAAAIVSYFVVAHWAGDTVPGLVSTTLSRTVLAPEPREAIIHHVVAWLGLWLAAALCGALLRWRAWRVSVLLLLAALLAPLQQLRIGEGESLSKHLAFGMVFAAPLAGALFSSVLARWRQTAPPLVLAVVALAALGSQRQLQFGSFWVDDRDLVPHLRADLILVPGKTILGEQPAPQRYALRKATTPLQWTDTYQFSYAGRKGTPAYELAIQQSHFGIIYLSLQTHYGRVVHDYLSRGGTPYVLASQVNRYLHGRVVGKWLVYLPKVVADGTWPTTFSAGRAASGVGR